MKQLSRSLLVGIVIFLAACAQTSPPAPLPIGEGRASGVRALAIDPRDGSLLKATSDGLYQSDDGGKNWRQMPLPGEIAGKGLATVAIHRDQPDLLYIAGEEIGIWRSRDGGKSWGKITRGLTAERVSALALHSNGYPRDSRKSLFAWVDGVGMFESHDAGDSWKRSVDQGMGLDNAPVMALTHTPLEGSMNTGWLYASTPSGAYLSMD